MNSLSFKLLAFSRLECLTPWAGKAKCSLGLWWLKYEMYEMLGTTSPLVVWAINWL